MTVQELIDKLSELPEDLRGLPVRIETENEGDDLTEVSARRSKVWWQADHITLLSRY
jgi:hypothetical protein